MYSFGKTFANAFSKVFSVLRTVCFCCGPKDSEEDSQEVSQESAEFGPLALSASEVRFLKKKKLQVLGEGAFGTCMLVPLKDGREGVLKVIHKTEDADNAMLKHEFNILRELKGAGGAPKALGICVEQKAFLMTCVGEKNAGQYLRQGYSFLDCWTLTKNVCARVNEVAAKGFLHNDIKFDNIVVDWQLNVSLIDFGCASRPGVARRYSAPLDTQTLAKMDVEERFPWIAPEVFQGAPWSPATEAYAFGNFVDELWNARFFRRPPQIKDLIKGLKAQDPQERLAIPAAIETPFDALP